VIKGGRRRPKGWTRKCSSFGGCVAWSNFAKEQGWHIDALTLMEQCCTASTRRKSQIGNNCNLFLPCVFVGRDPRTGFRSTFTDLAHSPSTTGQLLSFLNPAHRPLAAISAAFSESCLQSGGNGSADCMSEAGGLSGLSGFDNFVIRRSTLGAAHTE
jgi:hypothetical protein